AASSARRGSGCSGASSTDTDDTNSTPRRGGCPGKGGAAMSWIRIGAVVGLALLIALAAGSTTAQAPKKPLVVALNQDPDILDPTLARTYVGRIIFAHMCEKLYEIDEKLNIHPQLAAELPRFTDGGRAVTIKLRAGVKFNDGTPMTAEA